jgi:MFS superfamily sulfate permease-like transporter
MGLVLLFATGLFHDLPQSVLAALVLLSVTKLIQLRDFKYLYRISRLEFWVAVVAVAGVLLFGILQGVLLAAVYSLLLLLKRAASPRVVHLGRIHGTTFFGDVLRHPGTEQVPGVLVARVEGALLYFNVEQVKVELIRMANAQGGEIRLLILEMATTPYVDLAAAKMLRQLAEALEARGAALKLAEVTGTVQELLKAIDLEGLVGGTEDAPSAWSIIQRFRPDIAD